MPSLTKRRSSVPALKAADAAVDGDVRARILLQARSHFFRFGYTAFTMSDLATELGMSKKTLYVYFQSKDAILREVIVAFSSEVRTDADAILSDRRLNFAEKLRGFAQGMMERLSHVSPPLVRDLQRFAPDLYLHIEKVRAENIPYIFCRIIEEGQMSGEVRDNIRPSFAGEFFLHAMQGMMKADTMRRLELGSSEVFERALHLFFGGLLTEKGKKDYDKQFPAESVP